MKEKKSTFWVAAISGAVGAGFGSASGSSSMFVTICVGIGISLITAWGIAGMFK